MTKKEMSEIFAIMLLAYPTAETFKGGIQKLAPTIELWTAALPEVDFWLGQKAVMKLVRECKYPPTIAEFREKAESIKDEIRGHALEEWGMLKTVMSLMDKSPQEAVAGRGMFVQSVVASMGGPEKLIVREESTRPDGEKTIVEKYAYYEFLDAYEAEVRRMEALPGKAARPALGAAVKQIGGTS